MFANALVLAAAFEVLPFYQQKPDYTALRPFWSQEAETTDVLWPVFTSHRDWWRFCWFVQNQDYPDGGHQFSIIPIWWNGKDKKDDNSYWGLFPLWGSHPHVLIMHDWRFCLWPIWHKYRMPRREAEGGWMTTNAILFPFFHWRDDGSWGAWPIYGTSHNRADDHWYALWPIWNWKTCREDRDTSGAGNAWMLWPIMARIHRERESQWMFIPPLFSHVETTDGWRGRYPWPLFEIERRSDRDRTSIFPLWEHIVNYSYRDHSEAGHITRFGWRLVELLPDETRVFPFWTSRSDDSYFRLWPFWESSRAKDGSGSRRLLALFPIRWVDSIDRNWAKFWTFYEAETNPIYTDHSLFWGIIRWRTFND